MRAALSKNNQKKKNKRTESKFIKSPYQPTNPPCPCPCLPGGGDQIGDQIGNGNGGRGFYCPRIGVGGWWSGEAPSRTSGSGPRGCKLWGFMIPHNGTADVDETR